MTGPFRLAILTLVLAHFLLCSEVTCLHPPKYFVNNVGLLADKRENVHENIEEKTNRMNGFENYLAALKRIGKLAKRDENNDKDALRFTLRDASGLNDYANSLKNELYSKLSPPGGLSVSQVRNPETAVFQHPRRSVPALSRILVWFLQSLERNKASTTLDGAERRLIIEPQRTTPQQDKPEFGTGSTKDLGSSVEEVFEKETDRADTNLFKNLNKENPDPQSQENDSPFLSTRTKDGVFKSPNRLRNVDTSGGRFLPVEISGGHFSFLVPNKNRPAEEENSTDDWSVWHSGPVKIPASGKVHWGDDDGGFFSDGGFKRLGR